MFDPKIKELLDAAKEIAPVLGDPILEMKDNFRISIELKDLRRLHNAIQAIEETK
jgi:hypothetical protein